MSLEEALLRVERLERCHDLGAAETRVPDGADPVARAVLDIVRNPSLRPEHRARIYEDLTRNRDLIFRTRDPRLVSLIEWSEHVESLHKGLRSKRIGAFHYTRALEATCRRSGFELLPLMDRMEELGKAWGARDYRAAWDLVSAHLVELDPAGETPSELSAQL
ncbi:MAG: hypothetical protein ACYTGV_03190 [Planctomycetota bacterium]|jgi:hypothetical protein